MTAEPVVVLGAGGHGKVVADILLSAGFELSGFLDDGKQPGTIVMGVTVLGSSREWLASHRGGHVALGVGNNVARERAAAACVDAGAELVTAIHPSAVISRSATIEPGVVVMALAVVNAEAIIGRGAIINTASVIEHDCVIGAFAHVSPNAALAGACRIGARGHLGISASMLPGTSIGDDTVVGGGAVVVKSLPANAIAFGVPARVRT